MSIFNKPYRGIKIFSRKGFYSVFLLSTPLLLPLVLFQSLPSSAPTVDTSTAVAPKQLNQEPASIPPAAQQPDSQKLNATNLATAKTAKSNTSKSTSSSSLKQAVKSQKQATAKKTQKRKTKAKPKYAAPEIEIRVAIAKDTPVVTVGTSTSARLLDLNNKLLRKLPAKQGFEAQANGANVAIGDWQLPSAVVIQPTQGGYVYVGDRWYRGKVLLVSEGNNLLAVNYVDLEKYLYSVVGSEMHPTAPAEALKAQAIAARSYALVHLFRPANNWYNLGATERWQVYKGVDAEWNTSHQAVNQTAGQILSADGGIVESLYAASDEIVAKAHGGVGMSQTGAYKLAEEGYNYQQILGNYYPQTQLARLELKKGQGTKS